MRSMLTLQTGHIIKGAIALRLSWRHVFTNEGMYRSQNPRELLSTLHVLCLNFPP